MDFVDLTKVPKFLLEFVDALIVREGGFVDHPNDPGGATNGGITERTARRYGYTGSMRELPTVWKVQIYVQQYWYRPNFDMIAAIHPPLAEEMFDAGVLSGQSTPVKWLQRILNVSNRQQVDYKDITVDGLVGDATCNAIEKLVAKRGPVALNVLTNGCDNMQFNFFVELCERREASEDFFWGWTARTHSRAALLVQHGMA